MLELVNVAVKRFEVGAHVSIFALVPVSDLALQVSVLLFQAAHPFQIVPQAAVQELHGFLLIAVEDPFVVADRVAVQRAGRRRDAGWRDTRGAHARRWKAGRWHVAPTSAAVVERRGRMAWRGQADAGSARKKARPRPAVD